MNTPMPFESIVEVPPNSMWSKGSARILKDEPAIFYLKNPYDKHCEAKITVDTTTIYTVYVKPGGENIIEYKADEQGIFWFRYLDWMARPEHPHPHETIGVAIDLKLLDW